MIIQSITVTPVAFRDPPLLNVTGVHQPYALRSIIEVDAGDGLIGLGESYGDGNFLRQLERMADALIGTDVYDLATVHRHARAVVDQPITDAHGLTGPWSGPKNVSALHAAFELPLLDIQGKVAGRSMTDLLGGAQRSRVEFSAYLFYKWASHPGGPSDRWGEAMTPEQIVCQARDFVDAFGFRSLKLKGGVLDPGLEFETVTALRDAFPDHPVRWDPNAAWSVPTAVEFAQRAEGVVQYLEDPTRGRAGMAAVARASATPLATNMVVVGFDDLSETVGADRVVDIILADHHYWGGLAATQALSTVCEAFGLGLSMHSNSHLGISLAAMVHAAAVTRCLAFACDTHRPWSDQDLVANPVEFCDGAIEVPTSPGLGVTLDRDQLARLHEQYRRCGITERDDTSYMRTVDPTFTQNTGRW